MLNLDPTVVAHYQACDRRHVLEREWRPRQWRPKTLWEREFRWAIKELSNGVELEEVIRLHRAQFLGQCANPGLDLAPGVNSFIVAKDWAMMLEMVLRTVKRAPLLTFSPAGKVELSSDVTWRVNSPSDPSGVLHRWLAVDRWDQDELSRQVHGWWVMGDLAVTEMPMTLHVVEIGQIRNGRRDSCWTRGFRFRHAPNLPLRFKRPERNKEESVPEYLADKRGDIDEAEGWVNTLLKEGLVQKHILHVPLEPPVKAVCDDVRSQILQIAERIRSLSGAHWSGVAMARSACDGLVPCPWQECCYRWPQEDPELAGYVRLDAQTSTVREVGASVERLATVPASRQ